MNYQRKRVAKRLASGLLAGALALGGLAISGGSVSAKTPSAPSTQRISGADRYATAVAVARKYYSAEADLGTKGLVVASGENPNDALAASALAGFIDAPIVLVKKDSVPSEVLDLISDSIKGFRDSVGQKIYFVGGTAVISDAVKTAIETAARSGDSLTPIGSERLAGADRYATAGEIADKVAGLRNAEDTLIIVNGADNRWPDALSVGQLAANKKWPIILTGDGGLNDTAKAQITKYLAIPGSAKKFLLVGGTSVLPSSIESYLVSQNVAVRNIFREQGTDRYETNSVVNQSMIAFGDALQVDGLLGAAAAGTVGIALVSGTSPWDALAAGPWAAKNSIHLVLTSSPAPGAATAGLVGLLSAVLDAPAKVWTIGGTASVANSVRDAVVATAQGAADSTTSISGCEAGRTSVTFTIVGGAWNTTENNAVTATANAYWTKNGVRDSVSAFLTGFSDLGTKANGTTPTRTTFKVDLTGKLAVGDTIAFTGVNELTPGLTLSRALGSSSCVVTADPVTPTATVRAITDGANATAFEVTLSEPIRNSAGNLDATVASLTANAYWKKTVAGVVSDITTANVSTLSAVALDSSATRYLVTVSGTAALPALATVTLLKEAVVDQAGNRMAADTSATALPDQTGATLTLGAVTCNQGSNLTAISAGSVKLSAVSGSLGGAWGGRKGNVAKVRVVNQRGLDVPTIALNATSNLITITADTGYHTVADLATVARNTFFDLNWEVSAASGSTTASFLSATLVDASPTVLGTDDCTAVITYNEAAHTSGTPSLTVGGVVVVPTSTYANTLKSSERIRFATSAVGQASVVLSTQTTNAANISGSSTATSAQTVLP